MLEEYEVVYDGGLPICVLPGGGGGAATLSDQTVASIDGEGGVPQVTTDVGSGTLYYVVVPDAASAPSASEIKAGQRSGGSAAILAGNQSVSGTGAQNMAEMVNLIDATAYDVYFVQDTGSDSNVVKADFTTSTILIDDFTGTNGTTLQAHDANWTPVGIDNVTILSNQAQAAGSFLPWYLYDASYGADCIVQVTISTKSSTNAEVVGVYYRMNNIDGTADGYLALITSNTSGDDGWAIHDCVDADVSGAAITSGTIEITAGDVIRAKCVGTTHYFQHRTSSAEKFTTLGSQTDATINAAGRIGIYYSDQGYWLDNFGAGTLS